MKHNSSATLEVSAELGVQWDLPCLDYCKGRLQGSVTPPLTSTELELLVFVTHQHTLQNVSFQNWSHTKRH